MSVIEIFTMMYVIIPKEVLIIILASISLYIMLILQDKKNKKLGVNKKCQQELNHK